MSDEQVKPTVIPAGDEERKVFFSDINEIIGLRDVAQSAADSETNIIATLVEDHMARNPDDKKSDVKAGIKGIIDEHLKCTVSARAAKDDAILGDYEIAKKFMD